MEIQIKRMKLTFASKNIELIMVVLIINWKIYFIDNILCVQVHIVLNEKSILHLLI